MSPVVEPAYANLSCWSITKLLNCRCRLPSFTSSGRSLLLALQQHPQLNTCAGDQVRPKMTAAQLMSLVASVHVHNSTYMLDSSNHILQHNACPADIRKHYHSHLQLQHAWHVKLTVQASC